MGQGGTSGVIFNIQKFSVHDGPGIRTTVFMKGCPLNCRWCSNAESMNPEPELGIIRENCNNCGKCLQKCPENAISFDDENVIRFNRETCTACGDCLDACPPGALTIYGRRVTVDEVFREVLKDKAFYEGSSGGVTASGGEPLRQADFVAGLFRQCHEVGIGTCLDTCGYAPTENLEKVLAFTDYVLYDIKHMNADAHKQFTGVANDIILHNAEFVAASGATMLCRMPLIKGVNDTEKNIADMAVLVKKLGNNAGIELLPYHRLGIGKYKTLDKTYPGETFQTPDTEDMEKAKKIFEEHDVPCEIGG